MKKLSIIIIGNNYHLISNKNINICYANMDNIRDVIENCDSKYISFINENDMISDEYINNILDKIKDNYDSIYINYKIMYPYINNPKVLKNENVLKKFLPYYGSYIWNYVFKKNKLLKVINESNIEIFNILVDKYFKKNTAIGEIVYFHEPKCERKIKHFPYSDIRDFNYYKNIIYVGEFCKGRFNGYITWLLHLGKLYSKDYDITIIYEDLHPDTLGRFSKYYRCVNYDSMTDYICNILITPYTTYYYPRNIYHLEQNYLFIHGVNKDFVNAKVFIDDIFDNYVAVSKTAAIGSIGYYPTKETKYILNPYLLDEDMVKPCLRLVSTQRCSLVKRMDRIEYMASLIDELDIPYTWNVFSDYEENTNKGGLIFRERVLNVLPYVKEADYLVLLSDTESFSYSVVEALSVGTKVVVIDLPVYEEIGVKNNKNAIVLSRDLFLEDNKEELKKIIIKMYKEKDKKIKYYYDPTNSDGYKMIFK